MFPELSVSLSGLEPRGVYSLCVQAVPEGEHRYKWRDGVWSKSGRAEPGPPTHLYLHPESPAPAHRWMERPVCFSKIRLTNNTLSQGGQVVLQSMHRYSLRLYVIPVSSAGSSPRHVTTVSFPETSFIAVTSYQNPKLSMLKIEENPFAKGIKYFKNQQESHMPRKRIGRPEEIEDGGSECKKVKESAESPDRDHPTEEIRPISEESAERRGEKPGCAEESAEGREERQPPAIETARATGDSLEDDRLQCGRDITAEEQEREDRAHRTDMIVQWGPLPWLPPPAISPLAVTPYTPSSCLIGHRFTQPVALFAPPIPALPPFPAATPYYLGPWSPAPITLTQPHPQLLQQARVPPWYPSPHSASRGL